MSAWKAKEISEAISSEAFLWGREEEVGAVLNAQLNLRDKPCASLHQALALAKDDIEDPDSQDTDLSKSLKGQKKELPVHNGETHFLKTLPLHRGPRVHQPRGKATDRNNTRQ